MTAGLALVAALVLPLQDAGPNAPAVGEVAAASAAADSAPADSAPADSAPADPAPAAEPPPKPGDLRELARALRKSVVLLSVDTATGPGTGTGFVVREDGWIATNAHVIDSATRITATFDGGMVAEVTGVVARDREHDLAIVKVGLGGLVPLELGTTEGIEQGTRVVLLGNPTGLSLSLSDGIVAAVRDDGLGPGEREKHWLQRLIQITAPISPGSSGSPAVGLDRRVLGVAMGERLGGQNLNFIIPVERLAELMKAELAKPAGSEGPLEPVSSLPVVNIVVSVVFFAGVILLLVLGRRPKRVKAPKRAPTVQ